MNCIKCGKKNNENHKFCVGCGSPVEDISTSKPEKTHPAETVPAQAKEIVINKANKQVKGLLVVAGSLVLLIIGGWYINMFFENAVQARLDEEKKSLAVNQPEEINLDSGSSSDELAELKKEIETLKIQTSNRQQNPQPASLPKPEIKEKLQAAEVLSRPSWEEQANVVLDSAARIFCYLRNDKTVSGSGSVWAYGDEYYLVTNRHVLEEANADDEYCMITIARDWNAVSDDLEKAYEEDQLLIYVVDGNYTYWDDYDLAIPQLLEYEQPFSLLEDVAMSTNEAECNENLGPGEKIKIVGFPYTSSFALPTITEGIVSSWEKDGDAAYYITSAKIEHGNSGGIAVTDDYYCMVGIPTAVVVGDSESLGRVLMFTESDLKEFLGAI